MFSVFYVFLLEGTIDTMRRRKCFRTDYVFRFFKVSFNFKSSKIWYNGREALNILEQLL